MECSNESDPAWSDLRFAQCRPRDEIPSFSRFPGVAPERRMPSREALHLPCLEHSTACPIIASAEVSSRFVLI